MCVTEIDTYLIISNTALAAKSSHLSIQENVRNQVLIVADDAALLTEVECKGMFAAELAKAFIAAQTMDDVLEIDLMFYLLKRGKFAELHLKLEWHKESHTLVTAWELQSSLNIAQ